MTLIVFKDIVSNCQDEEQNNKNQSREKQHLSSPREYKKSLVAITPDKSGWCGAMKEQCPECGSKNVKWDPSYDMVGSPRSSLFRGISWDHQTETRYLCECKDCGHIWRETL